MSIAEFSTDLVWGAATVLAVSLIAFAMDLAQVSARRAEASRAEEQSDAAPAAESADSAGASVSSAVEGGTPSGGSTATVTATDEAPQRRRAAGIGVSTAWLGTILLGVAIAARGVAAGRAPWANMYEFTLVGAFVALVVFLGVNVRRDIRWLGAFVTGIAILFIAVAQVNFFVPADGLQPALQSYWLVIHVGVAIIASGIFTVAFLMSVLQLLRDSRDEGSAILNRRGWGWLELTPTPTRLEGLSFRLNAVGFVLWTFTVIAGAIWAEHAWGRYWGWDPKEVWSFVVWVVYAAYLHARTTRGWSGRRAAYFVLVGYACVIFNFTGVNLIFNGKHSYSGM
ncbi:c-type cytochrome biogenesis protein CcsB [Paraoerskovia marina]|uniref:c-type cytochrome biogenesis protein CcsB n=1 Tax=Paraoerskovia marina TaxID=545619 RepID=UPI000492E2EB|nr:c-type cytochrome biogenesis protein CcsB [Paraoerskovia marina]